MGLSNLLWTLVLLYGDYIWYLGTCRDLHTRNTDWKLARPSLFRIYVARTQNELTQSRWTIIFSTWGFSNAVIVHTTHVQSSSDHDGDNLSDQFILTYFNISFGGSRNRITIQSFTVRGSCQGQIDTSITQPFTLSKLTYEGHRSTRRTLWWLIAAWICRIGIECRKTILSFAKSLLNDSNREYVGFTDWNSAQTLPGCTNWKSLVVRTHLYDQGRLNRWSVFNFETTKKFNFEFKSEYIWRVIRWGGSSVDQSRYGLELWWLKNTRYT